jgi:hypothetical protein
MALSMCSRALLENLERLNEVADANRPYVPDFLDELRVKREARRAGHSR